MMIYTVTFNPSLDYIVDVDRFQTGAVNRTTRELMFPGGKGINVSIVLNNLGVESRALGFVAGFTGDEITRRLQETGVCTDFIRVSGGMSRINVKLRSDSKSETEINGRGPVIAQPELALLFAKLAKLSDGDILVLAGSIPGSLPDTVYVDILEHLRGKHVRTVVDATGSLLTNALSYHPFLVKPNHHELGEIFGVQLHDRDEVAAYGKRLQERGARNVLVSMAGEGAVLLTEDGKEYQAPAPQGEVVNSVGAGDSMVAGFLAGYVSTGDYQKAFIQGLCTGSASAFSEGLATADDVRALMRTCQTSHDI
jgi:1-phosphofructokinase